jgi:hypothetical protein
MQERYTKYCPQEGFLNGREKGDVTINFSLFKKLRDIGIFMHPSAVVYCCCVLLYVVGCSCVLLCVVAC